MAAGGPRRPFVEYYDDKKNPDQYVRVNVDIKGLKKKFLGGPGNADITFDVTERSFCLTVKLNSGSKDHYEYKIRELPEAISTDSKKTFWKVKKDEEVTLMLHKVKSGSWSRYLSESGLETAPDDAGDN